MNRFHVFLTRFSPQLLSLTNPSPYLVSSLVQVLGQNLLSTMCGGVVVMEILNADRTENLIYFKQKA